MLVGAKGIVLYSDPADYCAEGVKPYPEGWNLPGGGAQRGNVLNLNGAGDPLTPGYPAKGALIYLFNSLRLFFSVIYIQGLFWIYLDLTFFPP